MLFRFHLPLHDTYHDNTCTSSCVNKHYIISGLDADVYVNLSLDLIFSLFLGCFTTPYFSLHRDRLRDTNHFVTLLHLTQHLEPNITLKLSYTPLRHLTQLS